MDERSPKWQREIGNFKGIKSTFIIEGNISDNHPWFSADEDLPLVFCSIERVIANIFNAGKTKGRYHYQYCDPLFGFSDPLNYNQTAEMVRLFERKVEEQWKEIKEINGKDKKENHSGTRMVKNSEIIRASMTVNTGSSDEERKSIVNIVNFASRFLSSPDNMSADEITFFLNLLYASNNAIRGNVYKNTLILFVNKINDIPAWFFLNNPNVRMITVPNPDRSIRGA